MEANPTVFDFSRSMIISQARKRRKVEEKKPKFPIRTVYPNITTAARQGLTQSPFPHKGFAGAENPRFVKR